MDLTTVWKELCILIDPAPRICRRESEENDSAYGKVANVGRYIDYRCRAEERHRDDCATKYEETLDTLANT
jgi:hypothetical protein